MNQVEPHYSEKELCDAISCIAMCIVEAVKHEDKTANQWEEYLNRWNQTMYYPQEILEHMHNVISNSINALNHE